MALLDNTSSAVKRRAATAGDEAFLFHLYAGTREDLDAIGLPAEQKELLVKMQFNARRQQYVAAFPEAEDTIILVGDAPVGRALIHKVQGEFRLVDIALLPEFRGRGIGAEVIRNLLDQAVTTNAVVRLQVRKENPAINLYQRLGFSVCDDDGMYVAMEWLPESLSQDLKR